MRLISFPPRTLIFITWPNSLIIAILVGLTMIVTVIYLQVELPLLRTIYSILCASIIIMTWIEN